MRRDARAVLQAVEKDADLRLSDRGDDGLAGVLVTLDLEGGIGVGALLEEGVELALGAAGVGLDGDAVERVGEAELRRLDLAGHGEGVAGHGLELGHHHDVARSGARHVGGLLAAHLVEVAKALGLARARVGELDARRDGAGQHLEEGEAPVLRVVEGLEGKHHGALVVLGDVELLAVDQRDAAKVGHRGEPGHGGVHEGDDALLAHAAAREHGHEDTLADGLGEKPLELLLRDLLALEVLHHDLVVGFHDKLGELRAGGLGGVGVLGGDVLHDGLAALEVARLHVDDVDDAGEGLAGAHGDGDGAQVGAEALLQRGHGDVEVGVGSVEAVDEQRAGEAELLGRVPQAGGDGARPARRVHDEDRRLARAHGGVGVTDKVGVARGVEHVQARTLPDDGRDSGGDGEAALPLLAVVVQRGLGAGVAAETGGTPRQVEHGLGQHGLAHAALAHKDHVLDLLASLSCHDASLERGVCTMSFTLPTAGGAVAHLSGSGREERRGAGAQSVRRAPCRSPRPGRRAPTRPRPRAPAPPASRRRG